MGGTYAQCEERCMEDPNCRMMEYYFGSEEGGKKCNLFEHTTMEKSKSDQAHVGIKQ